MSLLMFNLSPAQVFVITDTLATTEAGAPFMLVSKCVAMPHLEMVVAFTGIANVGQRWTHQLQTGMVARDIDLLDRHVQSNLQRIESGVEAELGRAVTSSTIYHLGYSQDRECYTGYVYRSTDGYASEPMEPGFRIKPAPIGDFSTPNTQEELIELGLRLRTEQDARSADERIYIGGEFVQTLLSQRCMVTAKVHRFEDFESHWLAMNEALSPQSN